MVFTFSQARADTTPSANRFGGRLAGMDSLRDIAPEAPPGTVPGMMSGPGPEAFDSPQTLAAWALSAPEDEALGMRAVLALAGGPVTAPARAAARLISQRHRVETVRRLAGRVAAALARNR
jgi:hypothetical protein